MKPKLPSIHLVTNSVRHCFPDELIVVQITKKRLPFKHKPPSPPQIMTLLTTFKPNESAYAMVQTANPLDPVYYKILVKAQELYKCKYFN